MAWTTAFTELVGCRVPIQQAPMGSVSTPELALAVADAGGVGSITALGMSAAQLDAVLEEMAARTSGVLAANFLTEQIDHDAVAAAARRVRMVDFFWADPNASLVEVVHRHGALACWQVGSVDEALAAVSAGSDVVVAQGIEAGGHVRGEQPLHELLSAVCKHVDVPVVAAGGIGDSEAFAAVLREGAAGARIGTRFVAALESGAHPLYKQAVVDAGFDSTEITDAFSVCPLCATVPRARVLRTCIHALRDVSGPEVGETMLGDERVPLPKGHGLPPGVAATGHVDAMAMYAGESVAGINRVEPAAQIIETWCAAVDM